MSKFKIGDQVKIVNYGGLGCISRRIYEEHKSAYSPIVLKDDGVNTIVIDTCRDVIGATGVISKVEDGNYAIEGPSKHAWYDDGQLELVYRPKYKIIK